MLQHGEILGGGALSIFGAGHRASFVAARGVFFEIVETVEGPIAVKLGEGVLHTRFQASKVDDAAIEALRRGVSGGLGAADTARSTLDSATDRPLHDRKALIKP
jgi:hypothetical protein